MSQIHQKLGHKRASFLYKPYSYTTVVTLLGLEIANSKTVEYGKSREMSLNDKYLAHACTCALKSNCVQEGADGKNFEFLMPSFGLRSIVTDINNHLAPLVFMQMKLPYGPLHAGDTKGHIWGHDL